MDVVPCEQKDRRALLGLKLDHREGGALMSWQIMIRTNIPLQEYESNYKAGFEEVDG